MLKPKVEMKLSYNWLKELVDFDLSAFELAEKLTMVGLEVSAVVPWGQGLDEVVVGQVVSVKDHPQADRLSLCVVDVGSDRLQVVCGAPNVVQGQKVPVALPGTVLPDGRFIGRAEFREVESQGMICSERELGLSSDTSGIMVLDPESQVGAKLTNVLNLNDFILELDLTPNRPDCLSHVGVAREISALTGNPLRKPEVTVEEETREVESLISVEILDPVGCPRYTARVIEGVKVGPSPLWLRLRLESVGFRSVNNVVDATNYVLMELGHPLHAFDYHRLWGNRIVVRRALSGEAILTLDGRERVLDGDILVITDGHRPVALAGIMGSLGSEVTEATEDLLLESAYFDPKVIRRSAKRLGLSTEASYRFERGANPEGVIEALDRVAQLITHFAGGKVARGVVDIYPRPLGRVKLRLRSDRVNQVLGTELSEKEIKGILESLGFQVERDDGLQVMVPLFRPDVTREVDVVEEVARVYGYDKIEIRTRLSGELPVFRSSREIAARGVRDILIGLGMTEVVTNGLIDPQVLKLVDPLAKPLSIRNPLSREMSVLRPTLMPSILQVLVWNRNRGVEDLRIFELGKVFLRDGEVPLAVEKTMICGAIIGRRNRLGWDTGQENVDFFDLKGLLEVFFERISLDNFKIISYDDYIYRKGFGAQIMVGEAQIGTLGEVNNAVLERLDLKDKVFLFELDFDALLKVSQKEKRYQPLPRFPAVGRDLAVVVSEDVFSQEVEEAIYAAGGEIVESVELFDLYRGEQVPPGKKSLAFSLRYRSRQKTLSDEEVDKVHIVIVDQLKKVFGAEVRGLQDRIAEKG